MWCVSSRGRKLKSEGLCSCAAEKLLVRCSQPGRDVDGSFTWMRIRFQQDLGTLLNYRTLAQEGWISSRSKEKWASGYEHAMLPSVPPKYLSYRYHCLHPYWIQYSAGDIWQLGWPLCPSWIKSLYMTNLLWRAFVNSAFKDKFLIPRSDFD